jgi:sugar phosphate isomerase/epimerase
MTIENTFAHASLSTMWAIDNFRHLDTFFEMAAKFGFGKIELNHQVNSTIMSGITVDHVQFSSIHEPCPADISTKELVERDWLISSADETCRIRGMESIKKSIDLAQKLNAPVVVIHCGNATSSMDLERQLRRLFNNGQILSDEYQRWKSQITLARMELVGPRISAVKKSIVELLDYAGHFEIKLGLENRYHYMDIPSIDEMDELLQLSDVNKLGFIYDTGHAQAMDRLGFYKHDDWLKRFSTRMFGAHLHDVSGLSDHLAPGLGEIDFKNISPYLPENSFRTMELLPSNTVSQIQKGLDVLVNSGCISN